MIDTRWLRVGSVRQERVGRTKAHLGVGNRDKTVCGSNINHVGVAWAQITVKIAVKIAHYGYVTGIPVRGTKVVN